MFGDRRGSRKRLSLRLPTFFEAALRLQHAQKKVKSPGPTPTQVWRPGRLKEAHSATKKREIHVVLKAFPEHLDNAQKPLRA